ncbi:MAG: hypothetical protein LUD47_07505 [Clostridia bacterium]|nr:hypothetical protein [Clostridia bacterium]
MAEIEETRIGYVQGGGIYVSAKGAENSSFYYADLTPYDFYPKPGDTIIDPDGEMWLVKERGDAFVLCEDTGKTLKGEKGESENLDNYYTKEETDSVVALEAEKRRLADAQLGGRIDQFAGTIEGESTARTNGDIALTKLITEQMATEKEARETADTELQAAIDKLGGNLSDEKATREAKDAGLYKYITDAKTSVDGDLTALKESLENSIKETSEELKNSIEETTETIESELADETAARVKADAAEIRNRENADSVLGGRIDQFAGTIENEATTRTNADETLQKSIDELKENTEKSLDELDAEFQKAVTLEKNEREQADSELKETLENDLKAAIENEKSERETAVEAEKSEREEAIAAEKSERETADQNLQVALNTETETRKAKDTELEGAILTLHAESGAKLIVTENSESYEYTFALYNTDGELLGEKYEIDLPLESVVVDGRYDKENKELILTLENGKEVQIPVEDLIDGLATEAQLANVKEALETLIDETESGLKDTISKTKTVLEDEISTIQSDLSKSIEDTKAELESSLKAEETARTEAVSEETGARKEADLNERAERTAADTKLTEQIESVTTDLSENYYDSQTIDEKLVSIEAGETVTLESYLTKKEAAETYATQDSLTEEVSNLKEILSVRMSPEEVDALFE